MITAEPQSLLSWDFDVRLPDGGLVALPISGLGTRAHFTLEGVRFEVHLEGLFSGHYTLSALGKVQADAHKRGVFSRTFDFDLDDGAYELAPASAFSRGYELHRNDRRVGWIEPVMALGRQVECLLPEHLPLPTQIFILSVVLLRWRREHNS